MRILIRQKSGLGNQLFQYAAGLYFAKQHNASLEIIREPEDLAVSFGHPRPFLLSKFCISAKVRDRSAWDRLMCSTATPKKPLAALARFASRTQIYRPHFTTDWLFIPRLPVGHGIRNIYVEGYLQAHQFAEFMKQQVRQEFSLREPASGKNLDTLNQIRAAECPVSLHVRRGDYATIYGGRDALPMSYYRNAIEATREHMPNPTFFVFSDEIAFARENLPPGQHYIFVAHNDQANAHEDLRLMSSCRHHIIANSTFSWWAAWLNSHPAKLVFVPDRWLDPSVPCGDLMPPTWKRVAAESNDSLAIAQPLESLLDK